MDKVSVTMRVFFEDPKMEYGFLYVSCAQRLKSDWN